MNKAVKKAGKVLLVLVITIAAAKKRKKYHTLPRRNT